MKGRPRKKEYNSLLVRDQEIDRLFERMYENNVAGKISDERFSRMTKGYEDKQSELAGQIKTLRAELDKENHQEVTTDTFIATVCRYTRARKLTPRMLNEPIAFYFRNSNNRPMCPPQLALFVRPFTSSLSNMFDNPTGAGLIHHSDQGVQYACRVNLSRFFGDKEIVQTAEIKEYREIAGYAVCR